MGALAQNNSKLVSTSNFYVRREYNFYMYFVFFGQYLSFSLSCSSKLNSCHSWWGLKFCEMQATQFWKVSRPAESLQEHFEIRLFFWWVWCALCRKYKRYSSGLGLAENTSSGFHERWHWKFVGRCWNWMCLANSAQPTEQKNTTPKKW